MEQKWIPVEERLPKDRYLCKAKRTDNGEWVQGYYYQIWEKGYILWGMTNDAPNMIEVDVSTVCQCTGLKDENGKLIWENDIVVCRDFTEENYVISWKQDEACFEYQQYGCSIMNFEQLSGCEVEVIGNKFDNPELLEV